MVALIVGAIGRLVWALRQIGQPLNLGEAHNAAVGLAANGVISGVYRPPGTLLPPDTAPTAHLLPVPIGIAASVYDLLGIDSPASLVTLTLIAVTVVLLGFCLFYAAFAAAGMARSARLVALVFLCCIPLNIHLETEDFRYWEGGYAVALAAALLLTLARLDGRPTPSSMTIFGLAVLNALLFFVSPQMGLAGYVCLLLYAWHNLPARRWPTAGLFAALALALFIGPWTLRNMELLGKPIFLRSNLGLELSIAFFDGALGQNEQHAFEQRYSDVHPNVTDRAYLKMQAAGGEEPYAEQLGTETKRWMSEHPGQTVLLGLRHLREFAFPPIWSSRLFVPEPPRLRDYVWLVGLWSLSFFGMVGCGYALWRLNRRYQYPVIMLVVSALPYVLVQPIGRYHYVMYTLSVFFSMLLLDDLARRSPPYARLVAKL